MIALILPGGSRAESKDTKTIELNVVQVMQLAGDFVEQGKLDAAQDILTKVPNTGNPALETERWCLRRTEPRLCPQILITGMVSRQ